MYTYTFYVHNFCPSSKVSQLDPILNRSSVSLKTHTKATKYGFPFVEASVSQLVWHDGEHSRIEDHERIPLPYQNASQAIIFMTSLYDRNNLERMQQINQINYRMSRNAL